MWGSRDYFSFEPVFLLTPTTSAFSLVLYVLFNTTFYQTSYHRSVASVRRVLPSLHLLTVDYSFFFFGLDRSKHSLP